MNRIIFLLLIMLKGMFIHAQLNSKNDSISAVKIIRYFPDLTTKDIWNIKKGDTTDVIIYRYKDNVLYDLNYFQGINDVNGKYAGKRLERMMVLTKKNCLHAYRFQTNSTEAGKLIPNDSLGGLTGWIEHPNIPDVFSSHYIIKEVKDNWDQANGILTKEYSVQEIKDTTSRGIFTFKFSDKLKGIGYSLSEKLDSTYNKKLFYARIYAEPRYYPVQKKTMSEFEIVYLVENAQLDDPEKILSYFKMADQLTLNREE